MINNTLIEVQLRLELEDQLRLELEDQLRLEDALCNFTITGAAAVAAVTFGGVVISTAVGAVVLATLVSTVAGKALDWYAGNNERIMDKQAKFAIVITAFVMLGVVCGTSVALGISFVSASMFAAALASGLIASRFLFRGFSNVQLKLRADIAVIDKKCEAAEAEAQKATIAAERAPLVMVKDKLSTEAAEAQANLIAAESALKNCNANQAATVHEKADAQRKFNEAQAVVNEFNALNVYQMARAHQKKLVAEFEARRKANPHADQKELSAEIEKGLFGQYDKRKAIPSVKKWQDEIYRLGAQRADLWKQ